MKKVIKLAVAFTGLLLWGSTQAQEKKVELENSLLWEISGNGLTEPSYLYGTMHMMCEADFMIKEKVKNAIENTDKLALELDFDDPTELMAMQSMTTSTKPLSERLNKEDYAALNNFLQTKLGVKASQFENYTLIGIMSVVMFKSLNCPPKMYEVEFMQQAMANKKEILGLEKVEAQVAGFSESYTNEEFIEQLKYYDTSYFDEMVSIYKEENLNGLYEMIIDEKFMDADAKTIMLDNRNKNWVAVMPELMRVQPVFFAVGAGHLPGENGVINLLRNAGYSVKPVLK
ncbi:TraB/GumN family protein [Flavobacterium rakeshii]|uniref:TraB/GumN family protein n=1 Tax=Flavobacterium rakeshii TaxID=1038845 RepID=A0A6N8HGG2_9FLAO|nr:TraB/GumN family protein [Flavobacterium rakeshii]MEE1897583.1 TraB/GumN family protein [Flavobacterium rakeshii]MUV04825.1 TraB/GumN family protein [Flavobacterium rakeshii]